MFYLDLGEKEMCSGCQACESVCPSNCISMVEDEEGFNYPFKNKELCTDCGLCEKVCPFIQKEKIDSFKINKLPKAYLAINKDNNILFNSASGGVFSAVAKEYCNGEYIIFGAQFDDKFNVIHTYTNSLENISLYRRSKYVQSSINLTYKNAKYFLDLGKKVLFTGTPCQVAGLKLYLLKDYTNLFCLDLVCHGVPSQKVFNKYISYIENINKGKITDIHFRYKTTDKNGKWNSKNVKVNINGKSIIYNSKDDYFLKGYQGELFYRPSCYNCKYANSKRVSDITMGDFWGVKRLFPNKDVHKGVSIIIVNTANGLNILNDLKRTMEIENVNFDFLTKNNTRLIKPARMNIKRKYFFDLLESESFDVAIDRCIKKNSFMRKIVSKLLPPKIKNIINKILNERD